MTPEGVGYDGPIRQLRSVDPAEEDEARRQMAISGEIRRVTGEGSSMNPAPAPAAGPGSRTLPGAAGPAASPTYDRTLKDLGDGLFKRLRERRTDHVAPAPADGLLMDRGGGRTRSSFLEATDLGGGFRPGRRPERSMEEVVGDRTSPEARGWDRLIPKVEGFFEQMRQRVAEMGGPGEPPDRGAADLGDLAEESLDEQSREPAGPVEEPAADQDVGPLGPDAIGLDNLGAYIERLLAQPSGFDAQEIQQIRDTMAGQREEARGRAAGRISTDAARRGTFFSTIPAFQNRQLEERLAEEEALADAQLLSRAAEMEQAGIGQALQAAMQFLGQGTQAQLAQGQLALGNLQAGMQGMPTIPSSLAYLSQLPGGQVGGMDPSTFALLGMLMQQGQGGSGGGGGYQDLIDSIINGGSGPLPPEIIEDEVPPTGMG